MAKTRANKEGNIRQRADGRYEVRVTASHDIMTGKPKRISKYANTKEEAVLLLNQMSYINDTTPQQLHTHHIRCLARNLSRSIYEKYAETEYVPLL